MNENPTEEEVIMGSKPNYLYCHDFGKGRFFQVVHEDTEGFIIKLATRTMIKATYIKENEDIEGIEIIKLIDGGEKQKIILSKFNFSQLKHFLSFISETNLKEITERRLKLYEDQELNSETIELVKKLMSKEGGEELIETLINEGVISSKDIVNTSFRKNGVTIFKKLIEQDKYWEEYAKENNLSLHSEEKIWQFFFEKHQWIFGYGLDYRYKEVLQREVHLSSTNVDGSKAVITDFLLGDNSFTTFVEIKKPSTPIFSNNTNRSNSWMLSNHLIGAVSQILEHKASGLIRFDRPEYIEGELQDLKAYDSKVILIIGDWKELDNSRNTEEKEIKKKTFELFRRDSRNIEIITYNELYERAVFISEGKK